MNLKPGAGCIILVFLLSLAGACNAADSDGYLATLTGGESTIVHDTDDMMIITVHNPDPFVNVTIDNNTTQMPFDVILDAPLPLHAAMVFSAAEMKSISLVTIENLSLSDSNDILTLQGRWPEYFDGQNLSPYMEDVVHLQELDGHSFNQTGLYYEMTRNVPDNSYKEAPPCAQCFTDCQGGNLCIKEIIHFLLLED